MNKVILVFIIAALTLAVGCSGKPGAESANTNAAAAPATEPEIQPDGTTLMVAESNGIKSEVKTYPAGVLLQVVRARRPDGRRYATVKLRNGYSVDLQDKDDIDRIIEMSGDEVIAAVNKLPGAAAYTATPPAPASATPPAPATKAEVKQAEKPVPVKINNEGERYKPTDKTKTATSKKRQ